MTAKIIVKAYNDNGEVLHTIELDPEGFDDGETVKLQHSENAIAALWFYREDKPPKDSDAPPKTDTAD